MNKSHFLKRIFHQHLAGGEMFAEYFCTFICTFFIIRLYPCILFIYIYIVQITRKMSNSNSISPLESSIPNSTNGLFTTTNNGDRTHSPDNDRNLSVTLDDRGKLIHNFCFLVLFFISCVFVYSK